MHHISRLLTTNLSYVVEGVQADCVQIGSDRFWWGEHSGGQRTRDKREDAINCCPHPRFGLFGLFGPRPLFVLFVGLSFVSSSACQKVRNFAWSHGLLVPRSSKKMLLPVWIAAYIFSEVNLSCYEARWASLECCLLGIQLAIIHRCISPGCAFIHVQLGVIM